MKMRLVITLDYTTDDIDIPYELREIAKWIERCPKTGETYSYKSFDVGENGLRVGTVRFTKIEDKS
jgi:hypothetical protein